MKSANRYDWTVDFCLHFSFEIIDRMRCDCGWKGKRKGQKVDNRFIRHRWSSPFATWLLKRLSTFDFGRNMWCAGCLSVIFVTARIFHFGKLQFRLTDSLAHTHIHTYTRKHIRAHSRGRMGSERTHSHRLHRHVFRLSGFRSQLPFNLQHTH